MASCASGPSPVALLQFSACPCLHLLFRLSGSLKCFALLSTLPCFFSPSTFFFYVSVFLAPHPLLFHSSHTAFFALPWENCSSRSPSTQRPAFVLGDPLCSALCRSSRFLSLGLSVRLPLPMFNFLPLWPVLRRFLNGLPMSAFNQFPVCVVYLFLPVLCFITF